MRHLTREQWLSLRGLVGGSDAAVAAGESTYKSAIRLWAEQLGMLERTEPPDTEALYWGNRLEAIIVEECCKRHGLELLSVERLWTELEDDDSVELFGVVDNRQIFARSKARPWQTVTLDGGAYDPRTQEIGSIEAKNTNWRMVSKWAAPEDAEDAEEPERPRPGGPIEAQFQVCHQLAVIGSLKFGVLAGLVGGNRFFSFRFERDEEFIRNLNYLEHLYVQCVETKTPPAIDQAVRDALRVVKALHPDENGRSVELPGELAAIHQQHRAVSEQLTALKKEKERLDTHLRAAIGDNSYALVPGEGHYSLHVEERAERVQRASKFRQLRFSTAKAPKK